MHLCSALVLAAFVLHAVAATGSQIAQKSLAGVANESAIVVVGVVEKLDRLSSAVTDGNRFAAHVRIVSFLRGRSTATTFVLPLHVGGLRGFDAELAEGAQAVFFLRSIEAGEARLHTWGSIARLPAGYFHLD
ncbi:MAG: hypothetical protein HKP27_01050 [Myxococcales bacterium]|nr:hypothetical protein [Myxococcales bacterium]